MARYAVGDIQGCYDSLMKLLKKARFDPEKDELWSVGDLINRGPKDYRVLKYCMSLGDRFTCVLGNHDLHFLAIALGYFEIKRNDTFKEVLNAPDLEEIVSWLRKQKLAHYDSERDILMVHAGVPPQWSVKKTLSRAKEVEEIIQDEKLSRLYFANMYGNFPRVWSKSLKGTRRWRIITNYLTRMRFCDPKGKLEFRSKAGVKHAPDGYMPWFEVEERTAANTTILFGHWAALMGQADAENVQALDTGCVWGNKMTLINVDNLSKRISVKAQEK